MCVCVCFVCIEFHKRAVHRSWLYPFCITILCQVSTNAWLCGGSLRFLLWFTGMDDSVRAVDIPGFVMCGCLRLDGFFYFSFDIICVCMFVRVCVFMLLLDSVFKLICTCFVWSGSEVARFTNGVWNRLEMSCSHRKLCLLFLHSLRTCIAFALMK